MNSEFRGKVDECSRTAEEFIKLYYESVDKKRHQIARLYLDNGILVWNGNGTTGNNNIQSFIQGLPSIEHSVIVLDAQPIIDDATANQKTLMITAAGTVRIQNQSPKQFQQTFIVCAQGDKWKIVSDNFRIQDALATANKTK